MLDMWGDLIKNVGIFSFLLLAATILRSRLKILQNFFIPNSIIAGFIGLFLGAQLLNIFSISLDSAKDYIYHLLGITFIAISLKKSTGSKGKNALRTGLIFSFGYGIQAFLGLGLVLFIFNKMFPLFHPVNGILVQLGFSASPAVACNIAYGWLNMLLENPLFGKSAAESTGIIYTSDIGLTFGAIGFLIACIVGIILIRYGVKNGYTSFLKNNDEIGKTIKTGYIKDQSKQLEAGKQTTNSEAIDTLSIHTAIILVIYLLTYYALKWILIGFSHLSESVAFFGNVLVNFHFIIGAFLAMFVKKLMKVLKIDFILNDGILERFSGLSVDYMVTIAISAISIGIVIEFIIPILSISIIVGLATIFFCIYLGTRSFDNYKFERVITIFGIATGTMATGMALLRVMDPDFKTPIASEIMYGSGLVFFFTMPIMALINLPIKGLMTGNEFYTWLSLMLVGIYTIIILLFWWLSGLLKLDKPFSKLFSMK